MASLTLCAQRPTMHSLGHILRARRQSLGLTLDQLAKLSCCHKSYLSTIENGHRGNPSESLLRRLEHALRMPAGDLVRISGWQTMPKQLRREMREMRERSQLVDRIVEVLRNESAAATGTNGELRRLVERVSIPTDLEPVGLPVRAPVICSQPPDHPHEPLDLETLAKTAEEYVSIPDIDDRQAFATRVYGDAMAPTYQEGDIVVFSPAREAKAGTDCFVRLAKNGKTTFNRIYFEHNEHKQEMIRLQPLNSAYPPTLVRQEEVTELYAAVYVVRPTP